MSDLSKEVKSMIQKAEQSESSNDALKFSQAACNAANAMAVLQDIKLREAATTCGDNLN